MQLVGARACCSWFVQFFGTCEWALVPVSALGALALHEVVTRYTDDTFAEQLAVDLRESQAPV